MILAMGLTEDSTCFGPPRSHDEFVAERREYLAAGDPLTYEDYVHLWNDLHPMRHPFLYRFVYAAVGELCAA